jgi:hypothetical protein
LNRKARAFSLMRGAPLLLALGACAAAPKIPEPPSMLSRPAEYVFGDAIAAADATAVGHVVDLLGPRHGKPEVARYVAPANLDLAGLETYYDAKARAAGWEPIVDVRGALSAGENAIGYRADGTAFAVVWLTPRGNSAATPVNVIRFER